MFKTVLITAGTVAVLTSAVWFFAVVQPARAATAAELAARDAAYKSALGQLSSSESRVSDLTNQLETANSKLQQSDRSLQQALANAASLGATNKEFAGQLEQLKLFITTGIGAVGGSSEAADRLSELIERSYAAAQELQKRHPTGH